MKEHAEDEEETYNGAMYHDNPETRHLSDTCADAEKVLIDLYRQAPSWKKLRQVSQLTCMVQELALCDIRRRHPLANEREQRLRLASRWLSPETMRQVFGWDPEREGY